MLTREAILQAADYEKESVNVPQWGGVVYIRTMTARENDEIQIWFSKLRADHIAGLRQDAVSHVQRNPDLVRGLKVTLVSYCLCDDNGVLLFNDDDGRRQLAERDGVIIDRLFDVAMRINKLGGDDAEEEKKSSPETLTVDSSLSSVEPSPVPSES